MRAIIGHFLLLEARIDDAFDLALRRDRLAKQEGQPENYTVSFAADRVGRFTMRVAPVAGAVLVFLPVRWLLVE